VRRRGDRRGIVAAARFGVAHLYRDKHGIDNGGFPPQHLSQRLALISVIEGEAAARLVTLHPVSLGTISCAPICSPHVVLPGTIKNKPTKDQIALRIAATFAVVEQENLV
jgi:hypothetical protein